MLTESCPKVAPRFTCKNCDYLTDKKSSYDKHLLTSKHIKLTNVNTFSNNSCSKITDTNKIFNCKLCDKEFSSRVGLWKHNKTCNKYEEKTITIDSLKDDVKNLLDLVMELTNTNIELTKKMTDVCNILINKSNPVIS